MRTERLIESRTTRLELTESQANVLNAVGQKLVSSASWWGSKEDTEDTDERSILTMIPAGEHLWDVRVHNAVGLISIGSLQLEIRPKIPVTHLLYLFGLAEGLPRLDDETAAAAPHSSLWRLVALWYLGQLERLLRGDLNKGYRIHTDRLQVIRGRTEPTRFAQDYYTGRLDFHCEYEEFNYNTPLNRVLKAAARAVASSIELERQDRRRAAGAIFRMDDIGELEPTDIHEPIGRTTARYRTPITLARHVLSGRGRLIKAGEQMASTFLIPTPLLVQDGIRVLLRQKWGERVHKTGAQLTLSPSKRSINPDLKFDDGKRVGDVKYKLAGSDWDRSDLGQLICFAAAFEATEALEIAFSESIDHQPPELEVGAHRLSFISWPARDEVDPEDAAADLLESVETWLESSDRSVELGTPS